LVSETVQALGTHPKFLKKMSKKFKIIIIFAFVAILTPLFLFAQGGFADAAVDTNPAKSSLEITAREAGLLSTKDPIQIAGSIVQFLLGFLGIIFIVLLMYGGFLRMTARGKPEQITTSNKIITSAIIGVFIILGSWIITAYVFDQVNKQVGENGGGNNACIYSCQQEVNPGGCGIIGYVQDASGGNCEDGKVCCRQIGN